MNDLVQRIGANPLLEIVAICSVVFFVASVVLALFVICLRMHNEGKARRLRELNNKWEPALLKVFTGERSEQELWDAVPPDHVVDFVDLLLRFSRRLRGDELNALARLARPYLALVAERLKRGSVRRRALTVETLGRLGQGNFNGVLAEALDDRDTTVALLAARWLTGNEGPGHLDAILGRMQRFERWKPTLLASILASAGSEAAPALRRILADGDQPAHTRTLAAEVLIQLNDFLAADCAVPILCSETDRELTAASLRLLGRVGRPDQVEPVRRLVQSTDEAIRANAVTTLAMLGNASDEGILRGALDDPSAWVAMRAADGLKSAGHTAFLRELSISGHARAEMARQVLSEVC